MYVNSQPSHYVYLLEHQAMEEAQALPSPPVSFLQCLSLCQYYLLEEAALRYGHSRVSLPFRLCQGRYVTLYTNLLKHPPVEEAHVLPSHPVPFLHPDCSSSV